MTDVLDAIVRLAWPVLVGVLLWRLLPSIRRVIDQRGFTIKAGSTEISVQQASDQLQYGVEDLREQVSALKVQVASMQDAGSPKPSPIATGVPQLGRLLWVDDHPENNAFEIEALKRKGVDVQLERSTADALRALSRGAASFDAIITDMGRFEDGREHTEAGLELIDQLEQNEIAVPVYVYASAPALARSAKRIASGGIPATASATELLEMLGRLGAGGAPTPPPV